MLGEATARVENAAQNIANATTPGYKRRVAFSISDTPQAPTIGTGANVKSSPDLRHGNLVETSNPSDIALLSDGFFAVRSGDNVVYTRKGQFRRDDGGRLVTAAGYALQSESGRDLVLQSGDFAIDEAGIVLQGGQPIDRVAVFTFEPKTALVPDVESGFRPEVGEPLMASKILVRQGAYEASNVSTGEEMVSMMQALRRAETGQRLVQIYDDLTARALTVFGQP